MKLWENNIPPFYNKDYLDGFMPLVEPYIKEGAKSCVIICPGGGYSHKAMEHEGRHVAEYFNSIGVSAFVLDYRLKPYKHPIPVIDAKRAIRLARSLAGKYGYDKDKIGIMGFSAGAHLAGSAGTFKGDFGYDLQDDIDKESSRPDFMILCYPVVSCVQYSHRGSFENLSEDLSPKSARELSIEENVDKTTPPTFIFHTSGDICVPVENSLLMASALSRYEIPFEIHTFNIYGYHGVGLANGRKPAVHLEYVEMWADNLKNWLEGMGFIN